MEFLAKDYNTRADLEQAIVSQFGTDISKNWDADVRIIGSLSELKTLHLSSSCRVFGVKVESTEVPKTQTKNPFVNPKLARDRNYKKEKENVTIKNSSI